ncbi:aldehyde dehydrogenase [Rhodovulum sulfidophilum]|nr:aldehyde dehydrogenase [Rhodovulum sulfidophilum]
MATETTLYNHREKVASLFQRLGQRIEERKIDIFRILTNVETFDTALDEIDKTIRALGTYHRELDALLGRSPIGTVFVSLPFNNPLYSLMLYSFGPLMAGNNVVVRPSAITRSTIEDLTLVLPEISDISGLEFFNGSGREFIQTASQSDDVQALIFAGNWENVHRLAPQFPRSKILIYCGSGINPFIVDRDATEFMTIEAISDLIISSKIYNSGQDCLCTERILVHKQLCSKLIDRLEAAVLSIQIGEFGDADADINPLLGGISDSAEAISKSSPNANWVVPFKRDGALVYPSLALAPISSDLVNAEKFAPIFTVASFETNEELDRALDFEYLFGATVCGSFSSQTLKLYPHVTRTKTVIANESEDAHVPFGGRRRSGFVKVGSTARDGPILYSVETTKPAGK